MMKCTTNEHQDSSQLMKCTSMILAPDWTKYSMQLSWPWNAARWRAVVKEESFLCTSAPHEIRYLRQSSEP